MLLNSGSSGKVVVVIYGAGVSELLVFCGREKAVGVKKYEVAYFQTSEQR